MASAVRKLENEDIRAIFESLHDNKPPPPGLNFQIVSVDSDGLRLSPPAHEYEDGIYVLLRPDKSKSKNKNKNKKNSKQEQNDRPKIPPHLAHLKMKTPLSKNCTWSLSGPQFPTPTAIQQRYCYPQGNIEYASKKGGSMWTMYNRDGKEDDEYRLLHVYYSMKRANNRSYTSSASKQLRKLPKRKNIKQVQRKRVTIGFKKGRKKPKLPMSKSDCGSMLPASSRPSSPLPKENQIFRQSNGNSPPNAASASSECIHRDLSNLGSFGMTFEGLSIYPVPSNLCNDEYNHGEFLPFESNLAWPLYRSDNPPDAGISRERQLPSPQDEPRKFDSLLGIPLADPSAMMKEPSVEWSALMDPLDIDDTSSSHPQIDERYPEVLTKQLKDIHKNIIHEWIDSSPQSERERSLSVIASWARSISKAPLDICSSEGGEEQKAIGAQSDRKEASLKDDRDTAVEV